MLTFQYRQPHSLHSRTEGGQKQAKRCQKLQICMSFFAKIMICIFSPKTERYINITHIRKELGKNA